MRHVEVILRLLLIKLLDELINKWKRAVVSLKKKDRYLITVAVIYCIDQSDTKIIDSVALNELLDNSASLEPLHVDFNAENESVTNLCRKKQKKTVTSHYVATPQVWNTLKECEAI